MKQNLQSLGLSQEEIEALAMSKLSDGYNGSPYENNGGEYENMALDVEDVYDGSEDESISFQGSANSFRDESENGTEVTYTITNDTTAKVIVALGNGDVSDLTVLKNTFGADCFLADGTMYTTGGKTVVGAGVGTISGINGFRNFSLRNPYRVTKMVIQAITTSTGAVNKLAYNKIMTIQRFSPFRKFGESRVNLYDSFKTNQFRDEKIEVELAKYDIQRDDQTIFTLEIDPDVTLTITESIGAIQNNAGSLFAKAKKAKINIQRGTAGIVRARDLRSKVRVPSLNPAAKLNDKVKGIFSRLGK